MYYAVSPQFTLRARNRPPITIIYAARYMQVRAILHKSIRIMRLTRAGMVRIMRYYMPFLGNSYA